MSDKINNLPETENKINLEKMKKDLMPYLNEYLIERVNSKTENVKKEDFLNAFNNYSLEEKKAYRDYIIDIIKTPETFNDPNDDYSQLLRLIGEMRNIDRYEICAGFYNNCSIGNVSESYVPKETAGVETPSFLINSGNLTINGKNIQISNLGSEYMGNGDYQLFLGDYLDKKTISNLKFSELVSGELPKSLIIQKDKVFAVDSLGSYEIKTVKFGKNDIKIQLPTFGINVNLKTRKI